MGWKLMVSRVRKLAKIATKKKELDSKFLLDSSYVATIAANQARDSNDAKNIIDSDHVFLKQNKSFSSITSRPTTLSGYGITNTRTSSQLRTATDSDFNEQIVAGAPSSLNTLDKIAAAMNDDSDVFNTLKSFGSGYGYDSASLGPYTQTEQLFEADGVFTVPENVFNIDIWAVGGGGGGQPGNGARGSGAGGGGGAFARLIGYHVTPGDKFNITVGQAGEQGWTVRPGYNSATGTPPAPPSNTQSYIFPHTPPTGPGTNYANTHATASIVYDSSRDIQVLSAGGGQKGSYSTAINSGSTYSGGLGGVATIDSDAKNYYSVSSLAIQDSGGDGDPGGGKNSAYGYTGGAGGGAGGLGGTGGRGLLKKTNAPPSYPTTSWHIYYSGASKGAGIYLYDRGTYGSYSDGTNASMPGFWPSLPSASPATAATAAGTAVQKAYGGGGSGGTGGVTGIFKPGPAPPSNYQATAGLGSGDSGDHGAVRIDWRRYAF